MSIISILICNHITIYVKEKWRTAEYTFVREGGTHYNAEMKTLGKTTIEKEGS